MKIHNIVKKSIHSENFELIDKVNYQDLPIFINNSHLLLLTSFYEGFGRVVLEAMTFGLPCISTKSGGPEDLINNGYNGFIINRNNSLKLATKALFLIENRNEYKKMSINSFELAKENFNFEKISDRLINLLIFAIKNK